MLETSRNHPLLRVPGNAVFHETGPWCPKGWEPLLQTEPCQEAASFLWHVRLVHSSASLGVTQCIEVGERSIGAGYGVLKGA